MENIYLMYRRLLSGARVKVLVFSATLNNISVISWWSKLRYTFKTYNYTVLTNFKWLLLKTDALLQQIDKNNLILFY